MRQRPTRKRGPRGTTARKTPERAPDVLSPARALPLTKDEYVSLLKLVLMGERMVNSIRTGDVDDPLLAEYRSIKDVVASFGASYGLAKEYAHELECGDHRLPTEIKKLRQEYDDEVFWDELALRLGERDFFRIHSRADIDRMTDDEVVAHKDEEVKKYDDEFWVRGIERVEITGLPKTAKGGA